MFQLDTGNDGVSGPFLQWSARGTQDGAVNARSFYVRDGSGKTAYDASKGFVMDITSLKTGWQKSEGIAGVAPEWKWNPSPAQMMAKPGDDWKKGMSVRCALGGGQVATWEQAGTAVWEMLINLAPQLSQQPNPNQLPVVRLADVKVMQFQRGSTVAPVMEIVKWVDRPDALKDGAAAGIADEPAPAPQPAPAPAPSDDLEF